MPSDETPLQGASADPDETGGTQPKSRSIAITRLLLFSLLLCGLVALGYDLLAKRRLNQAYATMVRLDKEHDERVGKMGIDDQQVRSALGREPDFIDMSTNDLGQQITVEHYAFGGVFYNYMLNVRYQKKTGHMVRFEQDPVFRIGGR
jgi:hypothetical protein